ncbi:MAG: hypothetical protein EOP06_11275 [Proteobacteria bacterium]|nr:MAG: hypothetical protein EOP06_11275 [Pseudomonadota bacterium]
MKKSFQHNTHYTVEDKVQSPVKDQCVLSTCHLQGWASVLESDQAKRTGKMIEISTEYAAIYHWIFEATGLIAREGGDHPKSVELAATGEYSRSLFQKFGVVPASVWRSKIPFEKEWVSRMERYIHNIVIRTRVAMQAETNQEKRTAIRHKSTDLIIKAFEDQVGALPEKFVFDGKSYDPGSFQRAYFPEISESLLSVQINPVRSMETDAYSNEDDVWVQAKFDDFEHAVKKQLDGGRSVFLMYDHYKEFVDLKTGIMSIAAFKFPTEGRPLSRHERRSVGLNDMGHVVAITGYDLDPRTGKVEKWKIKNSWGAEAGDRGYFHMYRDYFRSFARVIFLPRADALSLVSAGKSQTTSVK